jgi:serine/threonine protein kinase
MPTPSETLASGALEKRPALQLLYGVATAADALSEASLVARDLTPERILVCPLRGGLLADMGIPLDLLPRATPPTDSELASRSPEELDGVPILARSNVYSMGAVFLATVTGGSPQNAALPAPAKAVISRAMATAPHRRYASSASFVFTLASAFGLRSNAPSSESRRGAPRAALERHAKPASVHAGAGFG